MTKWLIIGFFSALAIWYVIACFGAASYDDHGNKVVGWRRWLRFISLLPWILIPAL